MKIKRFLAPDMRTALNQVRDEHGPDAVILSNRSTPDGIEIVAASQYDEDLVRNALDTSNAAPPQLAAVPTAAPSIASLIPQPAASADAMPVTTPAPVVQIAPTTTPINDPLDAPIPADVLLAAVPPPAPVAPSRPITPPAPAPVLASVPAADEVPPTISDPLPPLPATPTPVMTTAPTSTDLTTQLREELAQMRQILERGFERLSDERLRTAPGRQRLVEWLEQQGFSASIIRDLAEHIPADSAPFQLQAQASTLLTERLPISPSNLIDDGGVIALIGPSGAGKTTTLAKLAAHYSVRHGVRDIALISLNPARPGDSDRLYSLARQLGIAVHEADSSQSLGTLLQWLHDYHLILIDTTGLAPHDPHAAEQLEWLRSIDAVRSLLVLPANVHAADLEETVRRFQPAQPQGAIITKLDETRRPGSVLSAVIEQSLPLIWVSDGQHLHDDLHRADASRLLLRLEAIAADDLPIEDAPYDPVAALVAPHAFA